MAENKKYEPREFIEALSNQTKGHSTPPCPFCGTRKYTSTESVATILINTEVTGINIGPTIPSGMLICTNCGHIHEGPMAPKVCPTCAHPQSYFELNAENY